MATATGETFEVFIDRVLVPVLPSLARRRRWHTSLMTAVMVGCFALSLTLFHRFPAWFARSGAPADERNWFSMILFAAVAGLVAAYLAHLRLHRTYLDRFRRRIMQPIAGFVDPSLVFTPDAHAPEAVYRTSLFFDANRDEQRRYRDAGLFAWTMNGMTVSFTNLRLERMARHGCRLRRNTLFGGLFIAMQPCSRVDGFIVAAPKTSGLTEIVVEPRLEGMGHPAPEAVRAVGNPEFNLEFVAFAPSRHMGEAMLTPQLTEFLLGLWRDKRIEPYYSRSGTEQYLALATGRDHFQPPPDGPVDYATCLHYRDDLLACLRLVELLAAATASAPDHGGVDAG